MLLFDSTFQLGARKPAIALIYPTPDHIWETHPGYESGRFCSGKMRQQAVAGLWTGI
jgi:hypothetical protein